MDTLKKNIHDGHRSRVKNTVLVSGLETLQPHQILEYLLFFAVPYKDTNELAHNLIERFGTFDCVLDAKVNDLLSISGMTKNAALFLHSLPEVFSFYERSKKQPKKILNVENVIPYLRSLVQLKSGECLYIVCLDAKNGIIFTEQLASGNNSLTLSTKDIIKVAMLHQANSIILCHNHPSDNVLPSDADINCTAMLKQTLAALDIKLLDHIIMGANTAYSFFLKTILSNN